MYWLLKQICKKIYNNNMNLVQTYLVLLEWELLSCHNVAISQIILETYNKDHAF